VHCTPKESALVRDAETESAIIDSLDASRRELGDAAPRFGLFLCDCSDADAIRKTLSRISPELDDWFEEVVVMLDRPSDSALATTAGLQPARGLDLRFHRPPRDSGFGAVRKAAFEYALRKGFDHVIVMRGDASQPPEKLPQLIAAALSDSARFVTATPGSTSVSPGSHSSSRRLSHRLSTFIQNRILGLQLHDYRMSFRLYPCEALARIPFQLNADDELFDTEIILQMRALGIPIREVPLDEGIDDERARAAEDLRACLAAIGYRLHQMHVTRDGRYLVDHDIHYTLKRSSTGSHVQIVAAIDPDSTVLDLGCSNGLLARPLLEKNVRVTGVDAGPGERLSKELADYYQRDLELPLELPYEREFDYVVCADVIEHLQNRAQLLRGARRYLKTDGRLIISTPNIALWFYRLSLLVGRFEYGPRGVLDRTHVHLYTGSTFRREIEMAGFTILRQRATSLPFEVVFESTGRSRLIRGLESGYHLMARLWPALFAYQHILEAQITTLDEESTVSGVTSSDDPPAPSPPPTVESVVPISDSRLDE
jgi:2-polyprenyl-3-methyl-5-hydroxy-6-metoxy-1,4-benzoquinol methylase